jgi:N-acetylglucosamine-6-phosphate deacetylase
VAGLPAGEYETLGHRVRLDENGRVESMTGRHLAGSGVTLGACVDHLRLLKILTEGEIRQVARDNPLRLIGLAA